MEKKQQNFARRTSAEFASLVDPSLYLLLKSYSKVKVPSIIVLSITVPTNGANLDLNY